MKYYVGIDGGGTRTTLGIADESGRELLRRVGPAGLVDARNPAASANLLVSLVHEAAAAAALEGPAEGLCAGLAGVGNEVEREIVESTFTRAGVARRVAVLPDGEVALYGTLNGGPGMIVIAGTGSVAHGRAEDGRIAHCGGWGMTLGDEGSGFDIARSALRAVLKSVDGRGPATRLLPLVLDVLGIPKPSAIPSWVARAQKSDVALLAVHVIRMGEKGDAVAHEIVGAAARALAAHVEALTEKLAPWSSPPTVVLHGGVATDPIFEARLRGALSALPRPVRILDAEVDAVMGALRYARTLP